MVNCFISLPSGKLSLSAADIRINTREVSDPGLGDTRIHLLLLPTLLPCHREVEFEPTDIRMAQQILTASLMFPQSSPETSSPLLST